VAKHRTPPPAAPDKARPEVSAGKQKFVAIWSKAWGLIGAIIVVFVAARLPDTLKAGDGAQLLRDFGLLLICFNLIMQATKSDWPMFYALPLTVFGISVWMVGWFA
jgi:hypothetical protein